MAERRLLQVLDGVKPAGSLPPPIWLMRQAGRYLPEYRALREKAGGFLDLCYNPDFATEVTLQPIRRFGFDAAILFSDILVIPDALDRGLHFVTGEGPKLTPILPREIANLDPTRAETHLAPVIATVARLRRELPDETALIGFCGAPWTVATYMIAGHGTPDQAPARLFAYQHPEAMKELIWMLADMSADYLIRQLQAGADCVQIFDSWAGVLDEAQFEAFSVAPTKAIVDKIRTAIPSAKIIGFAKGAGPLLKSYREKTGVNGVGLDWSVPLSFGAELQQGGAVQGNLDPLRLVAGGAALEEGIDRIMTTLGQGPLIFNLGHGITPQTPIAHVEALIARVRNFGN